MSTAHANKIAARYLSILVSIAEMAEQGELVSDLSSSAVRACLIAMQAAGAEPIDVYHIFGDGIKQKYEQASPEREKFRSILEIAYTYMGSLLLREEHLGR